MPKPHSYHLPNSTSLFRIAVDHFGQAEALQRHDADNVVSDLTVPGGQR
jgi:hypothetical protein